MHIMKQAFRSTKMLLDILDQYVANLSKIHIKKSQSHLWKTGHLFPISKKQQGYLYGLYLLGPTTVNFFVTNADFSPYQIILSFFLWSLFNHSLLKKKKAQTYIERPSTHSDNEFVIWLLAKGIIKLSSSPWRRIQMIHVARDTRKGAWADATKFEKCHHLEKI